MMDRRQFEVFDSFLFNMSDYREETQRQNQQQPVGVTEARPHSVREAGENLFVSAEPAQRLIRVLTGSGQNQQTDPSRLSSQPLFSPALLLLG